MSISSYSGLGGALGYMLGGLDWTGTALGQAFKSQEQVLFLFASIIFIISVTLHMFSIPEEPFVLSNQLKVTGSGESTNLLFFRFNSHTPPSLDVIVEEENESDHEEVDMDFLSAERMRCKSDSVLAMADSTIELDSDLDPDAHLFLPEVHHLMPGTEREFEDVFKPSGSTGSPAVTDGMDILEPTNSALSECNGPTKAPPPLLQIDSDSGNLHLNTQVKSTTRCEIVF